MKKIMGIMIICVGACFIAIGIVMICSKNEESSNKSEKIVIITQEPSISKTVESVQANNQTVEDKEISTTTNNIHKEKQNREEQAQENSSKEIGDQYEDFVANLLADWRLTLLERTQDKMSSAGVIAESSKNPDFHISQKKGKSNIDYYLECKYRSNWNNNEIKFEDWQIKRYKDFQKSKRRKVLIALGVGGTPSNPQTFMIVPLDSIHNNVIKKINTQFVVTPTSDNLVRYINGYFNNVFSNSNK